MIKNNKNQNLNLNFIQERLKKYENYFHVLGLPYDESKNEYYTSENEEEKINEQVKELYNKNINNIEKMLRGLEINEEIQKIKEEFIEKFQDAYSALKDRNSREHYIDLLKEIKDDKAENGNNHECKVKEIKDLGSHTMFMAEVVAINVDEKYIDEKGAFDISKCDLIAYANGGYYSMGKKLGKFGFSVKKKK